MIPAQIVVVAAARKGNSCKRLAAGSGVSLPTVDQMKTRAELVCAVTGSLVKPFRAREASGIELTGEAAVSRADGCGLRLKPGLVSQIA
jgi:hypothetical protein